MISITRYTTVLDDFARHYSTWIIAYCIDTDSFFCTNQRHFFWVYAREFASEDAAISYFRKHHEIFREIRRRIADDCGGINKNGVLYLENTREKW